MADKKLQYTIELIDKLSKPLADLFAQVEKISLGFKNDLNKANIFESLNQGIKDVKKQFSEPLKPKVDTALRSFYNRRNYYCWS